MLNSKTLDDLAARIGKAFEGSPAKDIEKNIKAMLQSGLARLDLVTRQEFDVQAEVLRKTRDKVERLEARVTELGTPTPATKEDPDVTSQRALLAKTRTALDSQVKLARLTDHARPTRRRLQSVSEPSARHRGNRVRAAARSRVTRASARAPA